MLCDGTPRLDAQGQLQGYIGHCIDITARKQAQLERVQSEARLSAVVEGAMDAIVTADWNQRIRVFNAAAEDMFGHRAQDMIGQSLELLIPHGKRHGWHNERAERGEDRGGRDGMRGQGRMMRVADTDENGQISLAEATAMADRMFTRMDRNKDGVISADDMPTRPVMFR